MDNQFGDHQLNSAQKLKIIEMVKQRPILWDTSLPEYNIKQTEDKILAWQEIAIELNSTPTKVATCFTKLRDYYRRRIANLDKTGAGNEPKWEYFKPMNFLRPVTKLRTQNKFQDEYTFYVQPSPNNNSLTLHKRPGDHDKSNQINEDSKKIKIDAVQIFRTNEVNNGNLPVAQSMYRSPMEEQMLNVNDDNLIDQPTKRALNFDGMTPIQNDADHEEEEKEVDITLPLNYSVKSQFHDAFGAIVAAKLNSLKEIDANLLMTDIFLMLLRNN